MLVSLHRLCRNSSTYLKHASSARCNERNRAKMTWAKMTQAKMTQAKMTHVFCTESTAHADVKDITTCGWMLHS